MSVNHIIFYQQMLLRKLSQIQTFLCTNNYHGRLRRHLTSCYKSKATSHDHHRGLHILPKTTAAFLPVKFSELFHYYVPKNVRCFSLSFVRDKSKRKENITMVKILNVAEKNDAAKNLANILSRGGSNRVSVICILYIL